MLHAYIVKLFKLLEFEQLTRFLISSSVISGITDNQVKTRRNFLKENGLSLQRTVDIYRANENLCFPTESGVKVCENRSASNQKCIPWHKDKIHG